MLTILEEAILLHTNYAEFSIHYTIYSVLASIPIVPAHLTITTSGAGGMKSNNAAENSVSPAVGRLHYLRQAIFAVKSYTSTWLTISPSDLAGISFIQWAQLTHTLATLSHVMDADFSGWNRVSASVIIDIPAAVDRLTKNFELAASYKVKEGFEADHVLSRLPGMLRSFYREDDRDGAAPKGRLRDVMQPNSLASNEAWFD